MELRDVDSGNKVTERFRTDEAIESMHLVLISHLVFEWKMVDLIIHRKMEGDISINAFFSPFKMAYTASSSIICLETLCYHGLIDMIKCFYLCDFTCVAT